MSWVISVGLKARVVADLVSEVVSEGVFQRYVSEVVSGARFPGTK